MLFLSIYILLEIDVESKYTITSMNNVSKLIISLALPFIASSIGSAFTMPEISTWYATLNKPFFNPPNWLFGPVWGSLFLLMGISLYMVWSKEENNLRARSAYIVFGLQLLLNTFWSIVFFGWHSPLLGFGIIILLWLAVWKTIRSFYRLNKTAGLIQVPYLLWLSFAAILNLAIVMLNKA